MKDFANGILYVVMHFIAAGENRVEPASNSHGKVQARVFHRFFPALLAVNGRRARGVPSYSLYI